MDSITQAVLGAAMGEALLGKQLKNRALAWGAFAGTIPDLDVLSRLFLENEIYGLIYHRGLTHSIFFTVLFSPFFGWLAYRYYQLKWHHRLGFQVAWAMTQGLLYLLFLGIFGYVSYLTAHWLPIAMTGAMSVGAYFLLPRLVRNIRQRKQFESEASWQRWSWMFFFAILTHWLIDACTSYGTQIFEPFSSYRISFDNIAIVDPLYTIPLILGCTAAWFLRTQRGRMVANWLGIGLSSAYMTLTFVRKAHVNDVTIESLERQGIAYSQIKTSPTMANTLLWNVMVEAPDSFYYGMYSIWDKKREVKLQALPKNHALLDPYRDNELVDILVWFAQDFYNVLPKEDGSLQFNNLRFGLLDSSIIKTDDPYLINYIIRQHDGNIEVEENNRGMRDVKIGEALAAMWRRMQGI